MGCYVLYGSQVESLTGPRHANKSIAEFRDFFPFYLSEHQDGVNRLLHVVGTTLTILTILYLDKRLLLSFASAIAVGLVVQIMTQGLATGLVEFGTVLATFLLLNRIFLKRWGFQVVLIGYAFAWVGHFFFELNRPATFIYPTYSLLSDFYMFYGVLAKQIPITFLKI
jgi:hypothetical protein